MNERTTIDTMFDEPTLGEAREFQLQKISSFRERLKSQRMLKIQEHTNGERLYGPKKVRSGTLEERIEGCAKMIAIQFLHGDEMKDDEIFARQTTFYCIPRDNHGDVSDMVFQLVEENSNG